MPGTPDTAPPRTLLAFDFGLRRIGAAFGQCVTGTAGPIGTASNGAGGPDWRKLTLWVDEWQPDVLVVGMPFNADGSPSKMSADVTEFARGLERFELPVVTIDERYSSLEAEEQLKAARREGRRGRITKDSVDAAAAVSIAERWLREYSA